MAITASELRANVYRILDEVVASGRAVEIVRRGHRLRIEPETKPDKLARLEQHPEWFDGEVEDIIGMDWSRYWTPMGEPVKAAGAVRQKRNATKAGGNGRRQR